MSIINRIKSWFVKPQYTIGIDPGYGNDKTVIAVIRTTPHHQEVVEVKSVCDGLLIIGLMEEKKK